MNCNACVFIRYKTWTYLNKKTIIYSLYCININYFNLIGCHIVDCGIENKTIETHFRTFVQTYQQILCNFANVSNLWIKKINNNKIISASETAKIGCIFLVWILFFIFVELTMLAYDCQKQICLCGWHVLPIRVLDIWRWQKMFHNKSILNKTKCFCWFICGLFLPEAGNFEKR